MRRNLVKIKMGKTTFYAVRKGRIFHEYKDTTGIWWGRSTLKKYPGWFAHKTLHEAMLSYFDLPKSKLREKVIG